MKNTPDLNICIVGVSRDCFALSLTDSRLSRVCESLGKKGFKIRRLSTIIEHEDDTVKALAEAKDMKADAAVVYLGNFGPEGPETIFAKEFGGPVMFCAAAEETGDGLEDFRGDALCGLLNASFNLKLRRVSAYIPKDPVGLPDEVADMIIGFAPVARILCGLRKLKIFSFGPRPQDFYACNAPIGPLYRLGVEVMENSELDLLSLYNAVEENDKEALAVEKDMAAELGRGNNYPGVLGRLARFEVALMRFFENNLGTSSYGIFANKCWPSFEEFFGFVPCYVNSRLAARGIPVSCEVDMYGALSEYMCQLASLKPATILDINNTVPADMVKGKDLMGCAPGDLFMGFHCGNTCSACLDNYSMKYQKIMKNNLEPDGEPDITRGTIEGKIKPGKVTVFRLQGDIESSLMSYVAEGNVLDIEPRTFGSIGVIAVPGMKRLYRNVLIEKGFPHHSAIAFDHVAAGLFDAVKLLGVGDISFPRESLYPGENPF
ncbi:MAG: fucose isomerase [Abditibacteriota bacterium]|nr:fucose isomerase [Abditibacteriota bacterium]